VDAVILAAGRGERLNGYTAPYHKPLLVVNGMPLINQAVDHALEVVQRVVVVVAPENAAPISQVLGDRVVRMVVQRVPDGPNRALAIGAELCVTNRILVLMADNLLRHRDVEQCVVKEEEAAVIGIERVPIDVAGRFTWRDKDGRWREGHAPEPHEVWGQMGEDLVVVWCGPLVVYRGLIEPAERMIGPYLNRLVGKNPRLVECETFDIGVPEMLT
jgi:hypothetical protein